MTTADAETDSRTDTRFAAATAVTPADQPGWFDVTLHPKWTVGGKLNGGYLLATLARAAVHADAAGTGAHPHPLAASAHFLAAPDPGPARVEVQVLRAGRSASQARARLVQGSGNGSGDRVQAECLLTLGRLDADAPVVYAGSEPVTLPPEDECTHLPGLSVDGRRVDIHDEVEVRVDPANLGFAAGRPGGTNELRGWLRFADGHEPDPFALLVALDVLPPATLDLGSSGWVPTLELTAYVRALPATGALRVRQRARHVQDEMVDEVCEVWDSRGRLVGQATQLARVRFA